jgi:hypothetical protein
MLLGLAAEVDYQKRQHTPNGVFYSLNPIHKTPFCYAMGSLSLVNEQRLVVSVIAHLSLKTKLK